MTQKPLVSILIGSDSDYPRIEPATQFFDSMKVPYDLLVSSAHRTPEQTVQYAKSAKKKGIKVIIAAAGGAAHLPGVIAALTDLPVIGIPIKSKHFNGVDSILSILEMPRGVPVATVGVENSENAAILACRILALNSTKIAHALELFRKKQIQTVKEKNKKLNKTRISLK